jgi:hypothetical protein
MMRALAVISIIAFPCHMVVCQILIGIEIIFLISV